MSSMLTIFLAQINNGFCNAVFLLLLLTFSHFIKPIWNKKTIFSSFSNLILQSNQFLFNRYIVFF